MLKIFDFDCSECGGSFEDTVEGLEGQPEDCPYCHFLGPFSKQIGCPSIPTQIIADYPGSKRLKAGYSHIYNRQAEKKGSQVTVTNALGQVRKRD